MRSPCCLAVSLRVPLNLKKKEAYEITLLSVYLCIPSNFFQFYMRFVSYQTKVGDHFFPELLLLFL
jgi:hypothetical protein